MRAPKRFLGFGCIECRARCLDLCKEPLSACEIFAEAIEDVFGFNPKGLELKPFAGVVTELLDFDFDEGEWSFEGVIGEVCQLREQVNLD